MIKLNISQSLLNKQRDDVKSESLQNQCHKKKRGDAYIEEMVFKREGEGPILWQKSKLLRNTV